MKITSLRIKNFRTIENLELSLHETYTAICGPNDSGKTNVIRAIRALLTQGEDGNPFTDSADVTFKDDFPKWKSQPSTQDQLSLSATLLIERDRDAGLFQSIVKQLSLETTESTLEVTVSTSHAPEATTRDVHIQYGERVFGGVPAQEVLTRIQSASCVIFHNSTQSPPRIFSHTGLVSGLLTELSLENEQLIGRMKKTVNNGLAKIARGRQREFEELLGKLEHKYKVGLSLPTLEFAHLPFSITLGEAQFKVRLDDWGSGTRNRTQILLALFTAKKIAESEESAQKTTPVMIIEEPECFLHPSAQAEFARVIRDLADEFSVQVIMTTHSPYMLSMKSPESNVLLRRKKSRDQIRETAQVDTSGENWMQPFAEALGLDSEEFEPWKRIFSASADSVLLVEGESDKTYFELLRDQSHGSKRLQFEGEILPYDGTGALSNPTMLRFFQNRYRKVFVTFDLDSAAQIEKTLQRAGMLPDTDFLAIGVNAAGRKNIEGLLPDSIKNAVRGRHPGLVDAATQGTGEEQKSARNQLKALYLQEVLDSPTPQTESLAGFYPVIAKINKGLSEPRCVGM